MIRPTAFPGASAPRLSAGNSITRTNADPVPKFLSRGDLGLIVA
jgi:hypothetical protein